MNTSLFSWFYYEILENKLSTFFIPHQTADELLSGAGGNTATKTEQAERLILDLLADGKELASEDIVKAATEAGISERTVKNARCNLDTRIEVIRRGNQWYYRRNEAKSAIRRYLCIVAPLPDMTASCADHMGLYL